MPHVAFRVIGCAVLLAAFSGSPSAQAIGPGVYFPPSAWDLKLPAVNRFLVLSNFNNQAVLDVETGLVWARSPSDLNGDGVVNFAGDRTSREDGIINCTFKNVAGRLGWRLPSAVEWGTLLDPDGPVAGPRLPPGHPFTDVALGDGYLTTTLIGTGLAWYASLSGSNPYFRGDDRFPGFVWCVRGVGSAER
jgi:hypothetical protein